MEIINMLGIPVPEDKPVFCATDALKPPHVKSDGGGNGGCSILPLLPPYYGPTDDN